MFLGVPRLSGHRSRRHEDYTVIKVEVFNAHLVERQDDNVTKEITCALPPLAIRSSA